MSDSLFDKLKAILARGLTPAWMDNSGVVHPITRVAPELESPNPDESEPGPVAHFKDGYGALDAANEEDFFIISPLNNPPSPRIRFDPNDRATWPVNKEHVLVLFDKGPWHEATCSVDPDGCCFWSYSYRGRFDLRRITHYARVVGPPKGA